MSIAIYIETEIHCDGGLAPARVITDIMILFSVHTYTMWVAVWLGDQQREFPTHLAATVEILRLQ